MKAAPKCKIVIKTGMIIRSDVNSDMTALLSYSVDENPDVEESAKSRVLVNDVNETKLILKKDGSVTMRNGECGGGCDLYSLTRNQPFW